MKLLRTGLLILLAVLLPFRGAMAVATACPQQTSQAQHEMPHGEPTTSGMSEAHEHHHARTDSTEHAPKCSTCATTCCATALTGALLRLPAAPFLGSTRYPAVVATFEHFSTGGQDRPPRTI